MRPSILPTIALAMMLVGAGAFAVWFVMSQDESVPPPTIASESSEEPQAPPPRIDSPPDAPDSRAEASKVEKPKADASDPALKTRDGSRTIQKAETGNRRTAGNPPVVEEAVVKEIDGRMREALEKLEAFRLDEGKEPVPFTAVVNGRVTDNKGAPIAGATVKGSPFATSDALAVYRARLGSAATGGALTATTDAAGNFSLTIDQKAPEGSKMSVNLTANAAGYAASKPQSVVVANNETKDGVVLALRGAGSVVGRVADGSGRGVPGATVTLSGAPSTDDLVVSRARIYGGGGAGGNAQTATTDASGNFAITGVPEGRHRPAVNANGWRQIAGPNEVVVKAGEEARMVADFVMAAAAQLKFTVEATDGATITGGATVQFTDEGGRPVFKQARRHDDGTYLVNDPPVGAVTVIITFAGYQPVSTKTTITDGELANLGTINVKKLEGLSGLAPSMPAQPG